VRQFPVTSAGSAVTTRPTTISTGLLQVCRPDILSRMMNNPGAYTGVKLLVLVAALMFLTPAGLVGQSQVKPADILRAQPAWLKQSSRGATLEATQGVRDGSTVQYHLIAKGLSSDVVYQVLAWPVTDPAPQVSIEGVSIGKDGIVMCAGREPNQCGDASKKDDPIDFTFNPARGEPFRLAAVSPTSRVAIVLVPLPIAGKDKGCTLAVVRLTPKFALAYATGTGCPPNIEAQIDTQSYSEKNRVTAKTAASGNLNCALLPFVAGHAKGTTTVKAIGGQCSPSLEFDWGN
jgi:hypothetical protein